MTDVKMTLSDDTVCRVAKIKRRTNSEKATIVGRSVALMDYMIEQVDLGSEIIIRKKDGSEDVVTISGL